MTKNIANNRIDQIVFSKIDSSLKMIQEELSMFGIDDIDVISFKASLCNYLKGYYAVEDDNSANDAQRVIFEIGEKGQKVPDSIAASVSIWGLRKLLNKLIDGPLKDLEDIQDKKVKIWAKNISSETEVDVDYKKLQIIDPSLNQAISIIDVAKQIMEEDPKKLTMLVKKIADDATGEKAFIRDFGKARLSSPEFEELLNNLQEAENEEILNEVVQHPVVAGSEHSMVIKFFAEQLKIKISLSPKKQQGLKTEIAA